MERGEECEMQIDREQAQQDAVDVKLGWEGKLRLKRECVGADLHDGAPENVGMGKVGKYSLFGVLNQPF